MKEHPIIFSGEMVRAILEGRKTQTRRVIKPEPEYVLEGENFPDGSVDCGYVWEFPKCPYDSPGDVLYVRETWATQPYLDGCSPRDLSRVESYLFWKATYDGQCNGRWRPSIHMPRWASRILLRVIDVRAEQLQKITDDDAKKEGCFFTDYGNRCFHPQPCPLPEKHPSHPIKNGWKAYETTSSDECLGTPRMAFANLWNSINEKRGYGWDMNPWVWVVEFEVSKP
jgi:hypothetical protein